MEIKIKMSYQVPVDRTASIIKSSNIIIPTLFLYTKCRVFSTAKRERMGLKGAKIEKNNK